MDYHQIGLFLKGLIIILANLNGFYCEIERDLILTPKLALHINGKTLYYKPTTSIIDSNTSSHVPWEQTLKHVTFLTLHNDLEENKDLNNFLEYKNFMNSTYIPAVASYIPKFGDIITLARGRLEKIENKNEYRFIEGQCNDNNNNNCDLKYVLAYWQVQKIRHRDLDRNFRYEIKFSVNPRVNVNNNETNGKREININNSNNNRLPRQSQQLKSFILKDDDYPKSFTYLDEHIAQRRFDNDNRNIYLNRLNAFNEVFTHPRYFNIDRSNLGEEQYQYRQSSNNNNNNKIPDLNIGEYIMPNRKFYSQQQQQPESLSSRISIFNNHNNLPTTYRPNYHLKFTKPYSNPNSYYNLNQLPSLVHYPENIHNNNEPILPIGLNENEKNPITTHLHHHFYMKNNQAERPQLYDNYEQIERLKPEIPYQHNYHQDTIDLIQQPLTTLRAPKQKFYTSSTPSLILNQIPIPPQQHQQLQPHDQYIYNNNNNNNNNNPGTNSILPSPPLFYMHPIPISPQLPLYLYPNQHKNNEQSNRQQPFRQSYKIESQLQYSEPDPLYNTNMEYKDIHKNNNFATTRNYENIVNTEINIDNSDIRVSSANSKQYNDENYTKPDSINAQLPPPNDGEDLTVPYVDNSSATESSSESSSQFVVQKQIEETKRDKLISTTTAATIFLPTKIHPTLKRSNQLQISNTTINPIQFGSQLSSPTISNTNNKPINSKKNIRISTTLQPKLNNINNFIPSTKNIITESSALKYLKPTSTIKSKQIITESITTVKPKLIGNNDKTIITTKKIYHRSTTERPVLKWKPKRAKITKELRPISSTTKSTNISKFEFERVPVNVTERVFTVTPSNTDISTKKSVSKSVSIKVGNENKEKPFSLKVKIPNVEVYEADLIKVNTTDKGIKFFKAYSGRDETEKTKENDIEEAELTQSIVEHVRSL